MNTPGPIRRYFRRNGALGFALHLYVAWHAAVFAMPRERLDWWPPYQGAPKAAYWVADVMTPGFMEPPEGTYADWRRRSLEASTPPAPMSATLEARVAKVTSNVDDPVVRNELIRHEQTSDPGYMAAEAARERAIAYGVDSVPAPLKGRGDPRSLGYAAGAYLLALAHKRRHCKRRCSST